MPRVATHTVARVLQGMVLQTVCWEPNASTPREQALTIRRHQMREPAAEPEMPVQPKTAAHGVNHARAAVGEFNPFKHERRGILWRLTRRSRARLVGRAPHWQATTPSDVAGATGAANPI